MSGECEKRSEHYLDYKCEKIKVAFTRNCIECGKLHDTGVENRIEGTFERIDKCIDCLMSKCSFNFDSNQVNLDETKEMSYEEMQRHLGETLLKLIEKYEVHYLPES